MYFSHFLIVVFSVAQLVLLDFDNSLSFLADKMQLPDWSVDDVFPMLQLLGCIKTEKLQHARCSS